MKTHPGSYIARWFLAVLWFALSACTLPSTNPQASPTALTATPTLELAPLPTDIPSSPTPTELPRPNLSWKELRDGRYGYAIAIPCWWEVNPTPFEGNFATMTLKSYDQAFFDAHSEKGEWIGGEWPPGTMKLDLTVFEGLDPVMPLKDAVVQFSTSDEQSVASTQQVVLGIYPAVMADLRSSNDPDIPFVAYFFRLAPDKMLGIFTLPNRAVVSPDVKGLLESLALSSAEAARIPFFAPSQPVIQLPAGCSFIP